ncbi:DNA polymerase thumb domain-containing protein [Bacillus alkalicellulosilyticus]|uniref:Y-family DNA polymerase n=1 Tax=Alkalihalobacterium alkalicellulosilyticum TaxID=1912214 RepID=UPI00099742C2|nr:UV damage repair protein UvrX [Bacillus alkalicellulosilyticus]
MFEQMKQRTILCVDMKSFYASCSALALGLDPLDCYLAVVADTTRSGSVVLAATPKLKKEFGIKTGSRLFEIPNDPRIQIVNAQMGIYLDISTQLTRFFNRYVPFEAIHVYSVDESFLQADGTEKLWGDGIALAHKIRNDMLREFGLTCSIGIGPNMLMSKLCLDIEAKKHGVAEWGFTDIKEKLWPLPLREMWGIGSRLERRLNRFGIRTVGHLAAFDLKKLEKEFGVMGNQLYYHAWGIDLSDLGAPIMQGQVSFAKGQILLRDYEKEEEIKCVILEMCEEVARRARRAKKAGRTISLGLGYSQEQMGGGFYRSLSVDEPTNLTMDVYKACLRLLARHYRGEIVRQISITLSNVHDDSVQQLSLFEPNKPKQKDLSYVMDAIREKYGSNALLRAVSYTKAGTARHRSTLLGGHKA